MQSKSKRVQLRIEPDIWEKFQDVVTDEMGAGRSSEYLRFLISAKAEGRVKHEKAEIVTKKYEDIVRVMEP